MGISREASLPFEGKVWVRLTHCNSLKQYLKKNSLMGGLSKTADLSRAFPGSSSLSRMMARWGIAVIFLVLIIFEAWWDWPRELATLHQGTRTGDELFSEAIELSLVVARILPSCRRGFPAMGNGGWFDTSLFLCIPPPQCYMSTIWIKDIWYLVSGLLWSEAKKISNAILEKNQPLGLLGIYMQGFKGTFNFLFWNKIFMFSIIEPNLYHSGYQILYNSIFTSQNMY